MEIIFLGTSAMVPTKDRNHPVILLRYEGENILFDCGENAQRQLKIANVSPAKITKLLISHWHGDHTLGIPGLIQSMAANDYNKTLEIFGPKNSKKFMLRMMSAFLLEGKINFRVEEVSGKFFKNDDFILEAFPLKHSAPCLAFSFIERDKRNINLDYLKKFNLQKNPLLGQLQKGKDIIYQGTKIKARDATIIKKGKKITYITDTELHSNCIKAAKNSDLLICEATFSKKHEQFAKDYRHLTAEQAAIIAKKAGVKKLILTHFSQRYKNIKILEKEAKSIFENTICSKDFMRINF